MPGPFPGMDPYLESPAFWPDFHERLITYLCDELAEHLPDAYEARIGERICLLEPFAESSKLMGPDVSITRKDGSSSGRAGSANVATLDAAMMPITILDEPSEAYIQILHRPDRTLITVLELLAPSNKVGSGRAQYLVKTQRDPPSAGPSRRVGSAPRRAASAF